MKRSLVSGLLAAALVGGCALPPPRLSPNGRATMLHTSTQRVNGELVAISPDTVWVLTRPAGILTSFSTASIVRLDVQRHAMGATRTMTTMSLVGAATGALLMSACVQVDDASCGAVLPGTLVAYLGIGAVLAIFNFESAWMKYAPGQVTEARAYARFPQGLPDTLRTLRPATSQP